MINWHTHWGSTIYLIYSSRIDSSFTVKIPSWYRFYKRAMMYGGFCEAYWECAPLKLAEHMYTEINLSE